MRKCVILFIFVGLAIVWFLNEDFIDHNKGCDVAATKTERNAHFARIFAPYNNLMRSSSVQGCMGPFLDIHFFTNRQIFETHWQVIRDEMLGVWAEMVPVDQFSKVFFGHFQNSDWKSFPLKWYGLDCTASQKKCPFTYQVVNSDDDILCAMFSVLGPRTEIRRHSGQYAGAMRCHLGLKIPRQRDKCFITVDGTNYHWKEGELALFDDTYVHSVRNDSDEPRVVLFMDIRRPLKGFAKAVNNLLIRTQIPKLFFQTNATNEKRIRLR